MSEASIVDVRGLSDYEFGLRWTCDVADVFVKSSRRNIFLISNGVCLILHSVD